MCTTGEPAALSGGVPARINAAISFGFWRLAGAPFTFGERAIRNSVRRVPARGFSACRRRAARISVAERTERRVFSWESNLPAS